MKTIAELIKERGIAILNRNKILNAPAETRGEGENAIQDLSQDQRDQIATIDAKINDLDVKIEEARAAARMVQEQRQLEAELRAADHTGYFPNPEPQGKSKSERRDIGRFSLARALRLASEGRSFDGIEGEMIEEGNMEARAAGFSPQGNGFIVSSLALSEKRDHTVGTATQGGNLVQTSVGNLLDALFEKIVFARLGADINLGLVGNFQVNRIVRGTAPADKAENAAADEHSVTFQPVTLTPRRVPTYLDISNQLFLQSQERNLERRITAHVVSELRVQMEKSYVTDLLGTSGIGDVAGGTNGANPTYSNILAIAGALTAANIDPDAIQYLINTAVQTYLMGAALTLSTGGEPVGDGKILPSGSNRLAGRPYEVTNIVPSNLTKGTATGVCSAIIAADFSGVTIGQWTGIEFLVDPYTQAANGMRRVHAAVYHDSVVNDPAKISAMQDALTV